MQLTHLGHSCLLIETASARLLVDPGTFSTGFDDLTDLDAVLITHQHPDHVDLARIGALLAANPTADVVVDEGTVGQLADLGRDLRTVRAGDVLDLHGARVDVVGGVHAELHRDIPRIPNVGYVVDGGAVYHPGDSFVVPDIEIDVLAVPIGAPWLKISEAIDFARAVSPRRAFPVHEAFLASPALPLSLVTTLAPERTEVAALPRGEAASV